MTSVESGDFINRMLAHAGVRRVLPHVVAALALVLFVSAGNWQHGRYQQKQALARQLEAAESATPQPLPKHVDDWSAWRYRVVDANGRFDAQRQILIDNKVYRGRVGYHVVTPLLLDDGRAVLVDRGWIAAGATRSERPSAPPPAGEVRVRGRINLPARFLQLESAPARDVVWQNLEPQRFAQQTGLPVLEVVLEQIDGASEGLVRDWPRPDVGTQTHLGYMLQWYAFAALTLGLWGWFTFGRRRGA